MRYVSGRCILSKAAKRKRKLCQNNHRWSLLKQNGDGAASVSRVDVGEFRWAVGEASDGVSAPFCASSDVLGPP
jgi:hypothetical protein